MGRHIYYRTGFRKVYEYEGSDDWYEERCGLFRYRTVNVAFSNAKAVLIERRPFRCFRCPHYSNCFRFEIMQGKYFGRIPLETFLLLRELNYDEYDEWSD